MVRADRRMTTHKIGVLRDHIGAPRRPIARMSLPKRPDAQNPGDPGGEATPVPIPNTEVKLSSAEDTERAAFRENRSSPGFLRSRAMHCPVSDPVAIVAPGSFHVCATAAHASPTVAILSRMRTARRP